MNLQEESRLLDQSMVEDEGHLVLTERTVETLKRIYKHTEVKSVLEIGFNAGHSAMGWLASTDVEHYHSIDICQYEHTELNAQRIENMFPERFTFTKMDSKDLDFRDIIGYDMVFVDGDHTVAGASIDIQNVRRAGCRWLLIDDYQNFWCRELTDLINHYIDKDAFPYHLSGIYRYDNADRNTGKMVLLGRDL